MWNRSFHLPCLLAVSLAFSSPASADPKAGQTVGHKIGLDARLALPVMQSGAPQKNYLRVALQGCRPEPNQARTPVNVAFVIDRSGSMQGDRIAQAKAAAIMAVSRLDHRDIASVVMFDDTADVVMQAQPVHNSGLFINAIQQIYARGSTAIHAGVLVGANEVRRYKEPQRLNRVILLSDGQANRGPSRPADFSVLGAALLREGISVSTIGLGLGYNEDLMLALARAGDGNHAFAREPTDLVQIFNKEFDDVLASCAQTVSIDIELKPGVRVVRSLSRDGTIDGNRAQFHMNQVYAATEHYVLMELEADKDLGQHLGNGEQELGIVKVAYTLPGNGIRETQDTHIRARLGATEEEVKAGADKTVAEAVVEQVTRGRTQEAILLRDAGKTEEANKLLMQNAAEINAYVKSAPGASQRLRDLEGQYSAMGSALAPASPSQMGLQRKVLRSLENTGAGSATRY
jgi:Ca-activated chloride channel family protein